MKFKKWLQGDTEEAYICKQDLNCCSFAKTKCYAKEAAKLAFEAGVKEGVSKARESVIKYFYDNY